MKSIILLSALLITQTIYASLPSDQVVNDRALIPETQVGGGIHLLDITVPVPGELSDAGTLEVNGTAGTVQDNELRIASCDIGDDGEIIKWGCHEFKRYSLNTTIVLTPGRYSLLYSHSYNYIAIKKNERKVIKLQKISVPKTDRPVTFSVFLDLTNLDMQERFLKDIFYCDLNAQFFKKYCTAPDKKDQDACDALGAAESPRELLNRNVIFEPNASWSKWSFCPAYGCNAGGAHRFENQDREYIVRSKAGEFISVLPGIYGMEFQDNQTGLRKTIYGLSVQ